MGLFDIFKKKQEEEIIRRPVSPAPQTRRAAAPPGTRGLSEEKKQMREELERTFDVATDALIERMETGNWSLNGTHPPVDPLLEDRFADMPFIDGNRRLRDELRKALDITERIWGAYVPGWDAIPAVDRYYSSFPQDLKELKNKTYVFHIGDVGNETENDDGLFAKETQSALMYNGENIEKQIQKMLPMRSCITWDPEGRIWCFNSDGIFKRDEPEVNEEFNWCANIRADIAEFRKELDGMEDGALRSMLSSFLDEQCHLITRVFTRFSACGQRIQKMREGYVIMNGLARTREATAFHELEDFATVREELLPFTSLMAEAEAEKVSWKDSETTYLRENRDFGRPEVNIRRVTAGLSVCYCIGYAMDNLRAYSNFAWPVIHQKRTRFADDISNYMSFRNYRPDDPVGMKYADLAGRIKKAMADRADQLEQAMVHYIKENTFLKEAIESNFMYVARKHESEEQIKWWLTDALWRRLDYNDAMPIRTPDMRFFAPWSVNPGELLELEGTSGSAPGQS